MYEIVWVKNANLWFVHNGIFFIIGQLVLLVLSGETRPEKQIEHKQKSIWLCGCQKLLAPAASAWGIKLTFLMFRTKTVRSTWERRTWRLSRAPAWCLLMSFLAILLAAPASFVPYKAQMPMSWWCAEHLTKMAAAKRSKSSKAKSPKRAPTPSGKGFTVQTMEPKVETKTGKASKKSKVQKAKVPEQIAPEAKPAEKVEVDPNESEEDREFRERYLSAEKEDQPDWKQQMDAAKTTEDRFKVGLKVGDFKTSYSILAEELLASFADGDKERLDNFLTKVGISSWQLALIQLIVIGVPLAGIAYVMGLWKWPAWAVCNCKDQLKAVGQRNHLLRGTYILTKDGVSCLGHLETIFESRKFRRLPKVKLQRLAVVSRCSSDRSCWATDFHG